jgi:ferric-dicitrate binding protein FerR (iron transport regulator)
MAAPELEAERKRPPRRLRRKAKLRKLARRLVAAAAGALLVWICPHWPEEARPVCVVLVEIAGVLNGP